MTIKQQEWNDTDNNKLKRPKKDYRQTFNDFVYIFTGTEGPNKFIMYLEQRQLK